MTPAPAEGKRADILHDARLIEGLAMLSEFGQGKALLNLPLKLPRSHAELYELKEGHKFNRLDSAMALHVSARLRAALETSLEAGHTEPTGLETLIAALQRENPEFDPERLEIRTAGLTAELSSGRLHVTARSPGELQPLHTRYLSWAGHYEHEAEMLRQNAGLLQRLVLNTGLTLTLPCKDGKVRLHETFLDQDTYSGNTHLSELLDRHLLEPDWKSGQHQKNSRTVDVQAAVTDAHRQATNTDAQALNFRLAAQNLLRDAVNEEKP